MEAVCGLDPSLTGTGVCYMASGQDPRVTVIRSKPNGNSITTRADRLYGLRDQIAAFLFETDGLQQAIIEQPAYAQTTGMQHDRAGLWWLVIDMLIAHDVAVTEVSPTTLKKYVTGRGGASKEEILWKTAREWNVDVLDNNGADALWLAAMGMAHQDPDLAGHHVTAGRKIALNSVAWAH